MVAELVGVVPYHVCHVPRYNYVHTEDRSSIRLLVLDTGVIFSIESNTVNTVLNSQMSVRNEVLLLSANSPA